MSCRSGSTEPYQIHKSVHSDVLRDHLLFAERLKKALQKPLPGWNAHREMINYPRPRISDIEHLLPNARHGAVLALVYPKFGSLHILLTLRHDYEGHHSGQVSFPGGKCESDDLSPWATALREAKEEVGVSHDGLMKLGELSKVYIPPSNFLVHPFVAFCKTTPALEADPVEVKRLIEAPLELLLHPEALKQKTIQLRVPDRAMLVKYFDIEQETVWGATGMMLNELKHIILSSLED